MTANDSTAIPGMDLQLHHVGVVVRSLDAYRGFYTDVLRHEQLSGVIHDPVQTAYVQFFSVPGSGHYLELVAPDGEESKLSAASRKGTPLNHLCYSCGDICRTVSFLADSRCFLIQEPVPAVAFGGRRIAWLMSPDRLLIELVERGPEGSL
jgi:methylmalonyl-CoA/ethylmalonyl-CoA epimerase